MKSITIYSIILSFLNAAPLINVGASLLSPTAGNAQNIGHNNNPFPYNNWWDNSGYGYGGYGGYGGNRWGY
jgi:hypothetical protein